MCEIINTIGIASKTWKIKETYVTLTMAAYGEIKGGVYPLGVVYTSSIQSTLSLVFSVIGTSLAIMYHILAVADDVLRGW